MRSIFFMTGRATKKVSPTAQKLIDFHGLDAASIKGTGKGGAITKGDVDKHLKNNPSHSEEEE